MSRMNVQHVKHKSHPPEKKIEVVTKYLALGNLRLVADLTKVDYGLIRNWKTTNWWKDLEAEIRASRDIVLDNKLQKLVDRALAQVQDRLENGDVFINRKTGETHRVEAALKDVVKAADTLLTQQTVLSKKDQYESAAQVSQSVQDQIKMLAQEFAKFNTNRTVEVKAKDVTDAVYDERKAGLQEAVREVRREAGSDQGTLGEESSPSGDGEEWASPQGGWEGRGSQDASEQGGESDEPLEFESGEPDDQSFFFTQP